MILLNKQDGKDEIEDNLIDIKRVMIVSCCKCMDEVTIIKDDEEECKDELLDELKWNVVKTPSDDIEFVCEDCTLTI